MPALWGGHYLPLRPGQGCSQVRKYNICFFFILFSFIFMGWKGNQRVNWVSSVLFCFLVVSSVTDANFDRRCFLSSDQQAASSSKNSQVIICCLFLISGRFLWAHYWEAVYYYFEVFIYRASMIEGGLADFPAVPFHMSHWQINNPNDESQLRRAVN